MLACISDGFDRDRQAASIMETSSGARRTILTISCGDPNVRSVIGIATCRATDTCQAINQVPPGGSVLQGG